MNAITIAGKAVDISRWKSLVKRFKRSDPHATPINRSIEAVEARMLKLPQLDFPLKHDFAPGVYARTIFMPAGSHIIGHCHRTEHFNIVISGRALVMMDGKTEEIVGPCMFVSKKNMRKVLNIIEDMTWITIHPTNQTDLKRLEKELIIKSKSFVKHQQELEQLQALSLTDSGDLS